MIENDRKNRIMERHPSKKPSLRKKLCAVLKSTFVCSFYNHTKSC